MNENSATLPYWARVIAIDGDGTVWAFELDCVWDAEHNEWFAFPPSKTSRVEHIGLFKLNKFNIPPEITRTLKFVRQP